MISLRQLIDRFLAFVQARQAPGTHAYYRHWLEQFLARVGDMPVVDVRRNHLAEFAVNWWQVQTVQRLFRWASVEMAIIDNDPFKGVKRPPLGNRRRVLSRRETVSLMRGSDLTFRPFLIAMQETAARPQEISAAQWTDLCDTNGVPDPETALSESGGWIQLSEFKGRKRRSNPNAVRCLFITDRLRRLLLRLWRAGGAARPTIFADSRGHRWNRNSLRCRMKRLRVRVGLGEDANGENAVLYTFRHSAATRLAAAGMGEHTLASILGHTSTRTTQRYVHLQREALRRAFHEAALKARKERWR